MQYSRVSVSDLVFVHTSQVMMADSSRLGCGIKYCSTFSTLTLSDGYFIVCYYDQVYVSTVQQITDYYHADAVKLPVRLCGFLTHQRRQHVGAMVTF